MNLARRTFDLFAVQPLRDLYQPPKGQIASLDFLRTCAILLVVAFHFSFHGYLELGGSENVFSRLPFVTYGWIGVDLFFVLSGYFIGKQLWREMSERGTIDLKRFVIRRSLRIWPLYFAVFTFVAVQIYCRGGNLPEWGWANLAFVTNYFSQLNVVPGSWTLSVEEQFYVFTPIALVLGAVCRVPLRWYRWVLLTLLVTLPLVRALVIWNLTGDVTTSVEGDLKLTNLYMPFHTHADGLVMGLLIANVQVVDGDRFKRGFLGSIFPVLIGAGVFIACFRSILVSYSGCALLFGSCTWFLIARRRSWLGVLDSRAFYVLSRLSFGMYLNHFYLVRPVADFTLHGLSFVGLGPAPQQVVGTVLMTAASASVAVVTFCLIEWPFLRLREWMLAGMRKHALAQKPSAATVTFDKLSPSAVVG